jgi:vacuolar-type H+-ATPase subunit H
MHAVLLPLFSRNCELRSREVASLFVDALDGLGSDLDKERPWTALANQALESLMSEFEAMAIIPADPDGFPWPFDLAWDTERFRAELDRLLHDRQQELLTRLTDEIISSARLGFERSASKIFRESDAEMWRWLGELFLAVAARTRNTIEAILEVACPDAVPNCEEIAARLTRTFDTLRADAAEAIPAKMKATFDRYFNQTSDNLVRVWTEDDDVDKIGKEALDKGLAILERYAHPQLPVVTWDEDRFTLSYQVADVEMAATRESLMALEFKTQAATAMDEARMLIRAHTKQREIPGWAWFLLLVLGWDQVMWVLKHPALAGLALGIGGMVLALRQIGVLDLIIRAVRERAADFLNGKSDEEEEEANEVSAPGPQDPSEISGHASVHMSQTPYTKKNSTFHEESSDDDPEALVRTLPAKLSRRSRSIVMDGRIVPMLPKRPVSRFGEDELG